jgi:hypothetical protein
MNNTELLSTVESAVELSEEQLDNVNGGTEFYRLSEKERAVITNGGGTVSTRQRTKGGVTTTIETVTMNGTTTVYENGQIKA